MYTAGGVAAPLLLPRGVSLSQRRTLRLTSAKRLRSARIHDLEEEDQEGQEASLYRLVACLAASRAKKDDLEGPEKEEKKPER